MAASQVSAEEDRTESGEESTDSPLLDSATATVKKLLARGKERGYVTYDELNAALPPEQVSSEQIEDTMAMLSEMGINVVDNEESDDTHAGDDKSGKDVATSRRRDAAAPRYRDARAARGSLRAAGRAQDAVAELIHELVDRERLRVEPDVDETMLGQLPLVAADGGVNRGVMPSAKASGQLRVASRGQLATEECDQSPGQHHPLVAARSQQLSPVDDEARADLINDHVDTHGGLGSPTAHGRQLLYEKEADLGLG